VHQIGPKESGSQNIVFLVLKAKSVGEVQILCTATATAFDRRKICYRLKNVIYSQKVIKK
jgi:hypothetical protein